MTTRLEVTVYDGKYTVVQDEDGAVKLLRYRQPWQKGDNVHLALASEIAELRARLGGQTPLVKRTAFVQAPLAHIGVRNDDDAELKDVVAGKRGSTTFSGAVVSKVKGGAGDDWLRVELYRE